MRDLRVLIIKVIGEVIPLSQNPTMAFNIQQRKEVKYLGYVISEGKRRLNSEKISGIINMTLLKTKWDLRKFLGLIGYCR
jgi:hypothetical protein